MAYGWRSVRDYHTAWLQQLEKVRVTWGDETKKLKLRSTLMWHRVAPTSKPVADTANLSHPDSQEPGGKKRDSYYSQPSEPGDRACRAFNPGSCTDNSANPQ